MTTREAIKARHSVRAFTDKKIDGEVLTAVQALISECNCESGIHFQLCLDEPEAFQATKPHYGKFKNCKNYIAVVSKPDSDELCGYYGQKIVLAAQALGLNTCWVVLTYKKGKTMYQCSDKEELTCVIAIGYGQNQGVAHKSKDISKLCKVNGNTPEWFISGMEAAALAPTAVNQQRFLFTLNGNTVSAKPLTSVIGYTKLDLGIVKYNFEIGAGKENFKWDN